MTDSKNQEEFKKVSEIQQRLDILIEHVESRKEALEEEIQEHLHESLANARDSIERIQENIAPKVEKAIHAKMEEIDRKMRRLNEDGLESVREELQVTMRCWVSTENRALRETGSVSYKHLTLPTRDLV